MMYKNPFHIVDMSPWPVALGVNAWLLTVNSVGWMWYKRMGGVIMALSCLAILSLQWWRDIIREAFWQGHHTNMIQSSLKLGMIMFILSEVMFFFSFFWSFLHSALSPSVWVGMEWPPLSINPFDPSMIPLLNTVILVSSGATLTWSHFSILNSNKLEYIFSMVITIILAFTFTSFQGYEYWNAQFNMSDSIYGSVFFLATGFHGLHVIIGSIFLMVCLLRANQMTPNHHTGLELASWYWHFVDVVWLFLYVVVYWWGS